jgi:hypothetical protein
MTFLDQWAVSTSKALTRGISLSLRPWPVHLSNRLADVGRRAEAVGPIEEAVSIYRRLVVAAPDAYLLDLARSFTTSH